LAGIVRKADGEGPCGRQCGLDAFLLRADEVIRMIRRREFITLLGGWRRRGRLRRARRSKTSGCVTSLCSLVWQRTTQLR
jgi:hypothetical protein